MQEAANTDSARALGASATLEVVVVLVERAGGDFALVEGVVIVQRVARIALVREEAVFRAEAAADEHAVDRAGALAVGGGPIELTIGHAARRLLLRRGLPKTHRVVLGQRGQERAGGVLYVGSAAHRGVGIEVVVPLLSTGAGGHCVVGKRHVAWRHAEHGTHQVGVLQVLVVL